MCGGGDVAVNYGHLHTTANEREAVGRFIDATLFSYYT